MGVVDMEEREVFALGLGLSEPWELSGQRLDIEKRPHELHLEVVAERGALFPCPECGRACKAHDFTRFTWQHLNFFRHHCFIKARVPRVDCPDHGVKRAVVPWARPGSRFAGTSRSSSLCQERVISTCIDQNPCAQSRVPIDIMVHGSWVSLIHASQHVARI